MRLALVALLLSLVACSAPRPATISAKSFAATTVQEMMQTTVRVNVKIAGTAYILDGDKTVEYPFLDGWSGSGVVYDKSTGAMGPVRSKILSANHVLEVPAVGSYEPVTFWGVELGRKRIEAVEITITTNDGRTCDLEVLVLGVDDHRDVATAEADCDAGRVARIALAVPARGDRIFISGHPLGVPKAMVTEGYVSDWWMKYLLVSAGAYGGNSGGPVFYNGEVIGLLVRGSPRYSNISLVTPLEQVWKRISQTGL